MIFAPIGGKNFLHNISLSMLMMIGLLCGLQGMSYADDSPAVELRAATKQSLTEANSNTFVVTLLLEGAAWAGISKIRRAVGVSGIGGVTIKRETYRTGDRWVCTSGCGGFVEFGYWEGTYVTRPAVRRKSDTVLEVPLAFDGTDFDFNADATLTSTVYAGAIVDYNGQPLRAIMSVTTTVSASAPLALKEQNLGGSVVTLTLTGGKYAAQLLDGAVTVAGIAGVGVSDVVRKSDTVLEVPLTFDGTDFDTDATLVLTVSPDAIANYDNVPVTGLIPVAAIKEVVSASVVSPLTEATLDGSTVTLLLTAAAFEEDISTIRDAVTVAGIDGVTIDTATLQRLSDRKITVELDYDGTDFITGTVLTFTLTSKAIANHNGEVTTEIPVTANSNEDVLTIFWTDWRAKKIQRADLDGSNVEDLVTGLDDPEGIALDVAGGKMYWTDPGTDKIQRADLDGSNVEDLLTQGLDHPSGIALDVAGGKMYWTDPRARKIQRANLDGSNVEDLVRTGYWPSGIALDVAGGKMYWTDPDSRVQKIQRANLDGSNVEDLLTRTQGLDHPSGIALDVAGGKMYWTDYGTDKIQRANLDGSNVEDLLTRTQGLRSPALDVGSGIALDVAGGKMYWIVIDSGTYKIQRANLDGSNVEDPFTELGSPHGIAIAMSSLVNPTTESTIAKEDVNRDGVVDVNDLVVVAQRYGQTGTNDADVNGDKVVNVDDLILVAAAIDAAAAAARAKVESHFTASQLQDFTASQLQGWLTEARASGNTSHRYQKGIAVLEQLLAVLTPKETALLANYPNPFNPTTTIRYVLPHATDVELTVYNVAGQSVRTLVAESQRAGHYAVAWDATDAQGQPVAAGLYFYRLQAGAFHAVEKMLLLK